MMYIAHDAFNRDLDRLIHAVDSGEGFSLAAAATWKRSARTAHPPHCRGHGAVAALYAAVTDPYEIRILTEMEAEHATLDPKLQQIDAMMRGHNAALPRIRAEDIRREPVRHMIHEETDALPLLERRTGPQGMGRLRQGDP